MCSLPRQRFPLFVVTPPPRTPTLRKAQLEHRWHSYPVVAVQRLIVKWLVRCIQCHLLRGLVQGYPPAPQEVRRLNKWCTMGLPGALACGLGDLCNYAELPVAATSRAPTSATGLRSTCGKVQSTNSGFTTAVPFCGGPNQRQRRCCLLPVEHDVRVHLRSRIHYTYHYLAFRTYEYSQ